MNIANKVTMIRLVCVPFFMLSMFFLPVETYGWFVTALIFAIASITDLIDGRLARDKNIVTDFGKLIDPMADKLIITAALLGFIQRIDLFPYMNMWIVMLFITRDIVISSIRMVASLKGHAVAAALSGKVKMITQVVMVLVMLVSAWEQWGLWHPILQTIWFWLGAASMVVSVAATVFSGIDYVIKNKKYINYMQ